VTHDDSTELETGSDQMYAIETGDDAHCGRRGAARRFSEQL